MSGAQGRAARRGGRAGAAVQAGGGGAGGEGETPGAGAGVSAPLAALVQLLGRRYALGVYWQLRTGSESFRTLAARLEAPETQLTQRLRELRESGIVEVDEAGEYRLTVHGRRLQGVIEPLALWADEWAALRPRQRVPRGAASRGFDEP
ncbi:winged helix-turn-helix transcriptional regulator [Frankia sp. AiPa1]|nr:winged helix-turn-helix transcriptional regulator [Frankia sp. AiPa1]MCL9762744.1 winged helix-turn-helix transcriptional regulator [Frankia sp. AiPa1]